MHYSLLQMSEVTCITRLRFDFGCLIPNLRYKDVSGRRSIYIFRKRPSQKKTYFFSDIHIKYRDCFDCVPPSISELCNI